MLVKQLKSFIPSRRDELASTGLLALNIFVLLTCYYLLKVVREPLILAGGGAEVKSYTSAGQAGLLLLVVPGFGALAARMNRIVLLTTTQMFFAGCLVVFYFLARAEVPYIGVAFYLWLGIFSVLTVSNFWSFASDLFTPEQGKRLFGVIGVGGSLGATLGAFIPELVTGTYGLMLVGAAGLVVSTLLYAVVDRRDIREHPEHRAPMRPAHADDPIGKQGGFGLVLKTKYLRYVALMVVIGTLVNSNGEFVIGSLVDHQSKEYIKDFYASYYTVVNIVGLAIQGLLVTRVLGVLGVRRALFIMPLVVLGSWTSFIAFASLQVLRVTKTAENSMDYSMNNTVKAALYLPTTREEKYKAKAAIDTFFVRGADVLSAGVVLLFSGLLGLGPHTFAGINIVLTIAWLWLAKQTGELFDQRSQVTS